MEIALSFWGIRKSVSENSGTLLHAIRQGIRLKRRYRITLKSPRPSFPHRMKSNGKSFTTSIKEKEILYKYAKEAIIKK